MWLYAPTIFISAFLLFLIQPIIAKQILPWFGGSASVWTTALVFFQLTLLAGYAYSDIAARKLPRRGQTVVHIGLLVIALAFLPIMADPSWKPMGGEEPTLRILGLLAATIGLPFFLLSSTGPLIQSWYAKLFAERRVYRLFALSNLASLAGLVCYPFVIEPVLTMDQQVWIWSGLFGLFVLFCGASAYSSLRLSIEAPGTTGLPLPPPTEDPPTAGRMGMWLLLSALGSVMLLATTNHITRDIASIPFLWILPLSLYLLTFVLCFDSDWWYRRWLFLPIVAGLLVACAWGLQAHNIIYNVRIGLPLYVVGMFFFCMFVHGELAADRPAPAYLTRFYLMVSLGGALGGMFVGIVSPLIFPGFYELGVGYILIAVAAVLLMQKRNVLMMGVAGAVGIVSSIFVGMHINKEIASSRELVRNFYAKLQTYDQPDDGTGHPSRILIDGVIIHGEQYLSGPLRNRPITYYGETSGVGRAMEVKKDGPRKVAVIGHGAGTMAAFGKAGDEYRFYEINPMVFEVADREFSFVKDTPATVVRILGDARLSLERDEPNGFDVMVIDAFSSDAVPVHLLSAEAMEVYLKHLAPDGIIAYNVTNRYLNLAPVIMKVAEEYGVAAVYVSDDPTNGVHYDSEFVLVSRDPAVLADPRIHTGATPVDEIPNLGVWTDNFNNMFKILR
jgi:hypothetical protein